MKTKIGFLFLLLPIFCYIKLNAQNDQCTYKGRMLVFDGSQLEDDFENYTAASFNPKTSTVLKVIQQTISPNKVRPQIATTSKVFADLIDSLKKYNMVSGMRLYFVVIPKISSKDNEDREELSIVWVPTCYSDVKGVHNNCRRNCETVCYFIENGKIILKTVNEIQPWIDRFSYLYGKLQCHIGRNDHRKRRDKKPTQSLWYSIKELNMFRDFLKCEINSNKELTVGFGVYRTMAVKKMGNYKGKRRRVEVGKQMTVVFHLKDYETTESGSLVCISLLKKALKKLSNQPEKNECEALLNSFKTKSFLSLPNFYANCRKYLKLGGDQYFDTGLPCPPGKNCIELGQ